ncbi:Beta-glucuronosyltransferase GlcAT14A [Dichanthelium oligosanthes]|uniref:Beta-glucuronosyltransferase GlcAT14A n=1 Tax=Dichanthelium oligosanthes TaxID=888268 RepID=A0A1E5VET9_9POAL|nr:Beta-glucuronosyltransferase GlcAT14A [Dichanthelium oligosanthes]
MAHSSWLTACSPWSAFAALAALTTSLLVLSYVSSSLVSQAAYEYDDPYSPDAEPSSSETAAAGAGSLVPRKGPGYPPVFAYYITGGHGDCLRVTRLLKAVYHPRNRYLLHLDAGAGAYERARLASYVRSEQALLEYGNVHVVGKGDSLDGRGPSAVAAVLRGAAVLLRVGADWDWLVTLSAADYPLVTQDDLLYAFSSVPRDLNLIDHRADSETHHVVVLDQNLLQSTNAEISFSSGNREKPDAFELYRGSRWPILSRAFVEHCVAAPDNLPRTLLMYFSNMLDATEFYFQTVMANSPRFRNSTINHSARFDVPPPQGADQQSRYDALVSSGAAFAGRFGDDDEALLQRIDEEVLRRPLDGVTPGEWCAAGSGEDGAAECSLGGDIDVVRQGAAGRRLASLISVLVGTGACDGCKS